MTSIERYIYDLVKSHPKLKDMIRNVYQTIFDLMPRQKEWIAGPYQYKEHYFLGFHDVQPFSADGTKLLAQHASIEGHMPGKDDALQVGYFDFKNDEIGTFHHLSDSYAWNYHKGCRLQWLDSYHLLFNTRKEDRVFAVLVDINSKQETVYPFAIDSVSADGQYATSLSFERIEYLMPGYGYLYTHDEGDIHQKAPNSTGLFLIHMQDKRREMLLSIEQLSREIEAPNDVYHYITHTSFSPDGRYIAFLHRFIHLEDVERRVTRLIVYDRVSKQHIALPTNGMVSHYAWNTKNQIIAYCSIAGKDGHALFNIDEALQVKFQQIALSQLNSDGHQSFVDTNHFITDTYPDRFRMAKLYLVNTETEEVQMLASIYSPKAFQTKSSYNHIACDLHPRVSKDGRYVCFDSPRTNVRSLYIMNIQSHTHA